jgi:hypothetical protein
MAKFCWVVAIEVDESWVADGFELTDERAHQMVGQALPYAYENEFSAKVLRGPDRRDIDAAQGYTATDIRAGEKV